MFAGAEEATVNGAVRVEVMMRLEVFEVCTGVTELQAPNSDWQPVPQYSLVFPLQRELVNRLDIVRCMKTPTSSHTENSSHPTVTLCRSWH
jgi:hypothetical protein